MSTTMPEARPNAMLSTRETRRFLSDYVRKRVGEQDVDDVVQTVLMDALAAQRIPEVDSELRRWLIGIARHKIADHHRKAGREQPAELPDLEASAPPLEERQMATWAERQAPASKEAARTLEWMAREGEGEKLEQIAIDEQVAAATVRQRVSRMRRWMRERWMAELAAVAALAILAFAVYRWLYKPPPPVTREPPAIDDKRDDLDFKGPPQKIAPSPLDRARELRRAAGEDCSRRDFAPCLQKLDEARDLDPAGDRAPDVQDMRAGAKAAEEESQRKGSVKGGLQNDGVGEPPLDGKGDGSKGKAAPPSTATPPTPNPKTGPGPSKPVPKSNGGKTSVDLKKEMEKKAMMAKKPGASDTLGSDEPNGPGPDSNIVLAPAGSGSPAKPTANFPQQATPPPQPAQQQAFKDKK